MPYTPPNVYYSSTFGGTYTKLDGVQAVNIVRGRSRFQDPASASRCVIELIPQSTYPANIALNEFIDIRDANNGTSPAYFVGKIIDIQRRYEIPYNSTSGAAPGDRVFITLIGGTGVLASGFAGYTSGATNDAAYNIVSGSLDVAGVYCITPQNLSYDPTNPAAWNPIGINVINPQPAPWLENINKILNTIQYTIDDLDLNRTAKPTYKSTQLNFGAYCYPIGQTGVSISFVDDGTTGSSIYKYSDLEFSSSVQSSFSQVIVESTLADQISTTGTEPYIGLQYSTAIATAAQGLSLGAYILTVNSSTAPAPFTVGSTSAVQESVAQLGKLANCPIGSAVVFKFRGGTYQATVTGISANYYPAIANIRLTLTPSLGTPFTLDSTAFGVLDTNRLGYP